VVFPLRFARDREDEAVEVEEAAFEIVPIGEIEEASATVVGPD
jgi:hypothetical protein